MREFHCFFVVINNGGRWNAVAGRGQRQLGKRTYVAEAQHGSLHLLRFGLTQHIDRNAMGFVGRRDTAIHGDQKEDVLDLLTEGEPEVKVGPGALRRALV